MGTRVTVKGQVTLPKAAREAAGIAPGDEVEVRATATGAIVVEKVGRRDDYAARLRALARKRPIRDITTDELMAMSRDEE